MENCYKRLLKVQKAAAEQQFTPSGKNKFKKYEYMELGDFLPFITVECAKNNILMEFDFSGNEALLNLIDAETGEVFYGTMIPLPTFKEFEDKNAMQNIGAVITYAKRYLLSSVFLISENSYIDSDEYEKAEVVGEVELKENEPVRLDVDLKQVPTTNDIPITDVTPTETEKTIEETETVEVNDNRKLYEDFKSRVKVPESDGKFRNKMNYQLHRYRKENPGVLSHEDIVELKGFINKASLGAK